MRTEQPAAVTLLQRLVLPAIAVAAVASPLLAAQAPPTLEREGKTSGIMASSLAFSPDGHTLAAAGGEGSVDAKAGQVSLSTSGGIVLVDAERMKSGKRVATGSWPRQLAFSADGTELVGVIDSELRRWGAKDGHPLATLAKGVENVAYSVDGTSAVVALSSGGYAVLELPSGKTLATHAAVPEANESKLFVTVAGPTLAYVKDGELRLRILSGAEALSAGAWSEGGISAVAVGPDGKTVAFGTDSGAVVLVDAATAKRLKANALSNARVNAIAFAPNGSAVAYGGVNAAVNLWSLASDEVQISFGQHRFPILAVAFAADGRRLATSSFDTTIKLWQVAAGAAEPRAGAVAVPAAEREAPARGPSVSAPADPCQRIHMGVGATLTAHLKGVRETFPVRAGKMTGFERFEACARFESLPERVRNMAVRRGYHSGDGVVFDINTDGEAELRSRGD